MMADLAIAFFLRWDSSGKLCRGNWACIGMWRESLEIWAFSSASKKSLKQGLTFTFYSVRLYNCESQVKHFFSSPKPPSSSGLGHLPFTEATGIRIPLGVLTKRASVNSEALFAFIGNLRWLLYLLTQLYKQCGDRFLIGIGGRDELCHGAMNRISIEYGFQKLCSSKPRWRRLFPIMSVG